MFTNKFTSPFNRFVYLFYKKTINLHKPIPIALDSTPASRFSFQS